MKLMLTVETFKSGDRNGVVWASATGVDALGRRARAAFRDPREGDGRKRATAMIEQMTAAVPPGQDVADIRPIVECFGSWRERPLYRQGKPVMKGDEPATERFFEVASFNLLSGPALELRRTKHRASQVVDVVAAALEAGDPVKAADVALEFLRLFSGRPADELDDVDADEPDEAGPEAPVGPEAAAAAPGSAPMADAEAPQPDAPAAAEPPVVGTDVVEIEEVAPVAQEATVAAPASQADAEPAAPAPIADRPAQAAPTEEIPAAPQSASAEVDGDFESLVAAVEAAPPVHPEPAAGESSPAARTAPPRPDLGKAPPSSAAARQPLAPRAPAAAPRPAAAPLVRPVAPASVRPVAGRPAVPAAAAPRPAIHTPAQRQGGAQAPQRTAAPASELRLAPTAAIAPPSGVYRRPEPGEDPEALAAAHLARRRGPGVPQAVRPPQVRPGVR